MGQTQSVKAQALFQPGCKGNPSIDGFVRFVNNKCEIKVKGLKPNTVHAIHIHEFGNLSAGCKSCGGHYNPTCETHGSYLYPERGRHVGDLINNIKSNDSGKVHLSFSINFDIQDILGRSVVIHDLPDDLGRKGASVDGKFTYYKNMNLEQLKKYAFARNYYKRGDQASRIGIIKKLIAESMVTGNAGGRMACSIIGRLN